MEHQNKKDSIESVDEKWQIRNNAVDFLVLTKDVEEDGIEV